ncbi:MAG: radical SAM protein [Desulfobacterales bacterium]|nr:radical SAM protein [Desulfobacterales bacterium]
MKILLINPPARKPEYQSIVVPPLGLLYVAAHLKSAGFDVSVKDAFAESMDWAQFAAYIRDEKPEVLCIGGMSPVIDTVFKAIKIARPNTRFIVMGGPHASLYRQSVFDQCPEVDYVVTGEGEETATALMKALEAGATVAGIAGVVSKSIINDDRPLISDIDALHNPDRSLVPNNLYRYPLLKYRQATTMMTSRGCPYGCTFCDKSTFGSTWRARSVENILTEIDEIINRYQIRSVIFYDDLFTVKKERVTGLCEEILRRGYKFDWKCEGRVNLVDSEVMRLMRRAGCSMIAYGVESANRIGLDYLNKNISVDQIIRAFEMTRQAGIRTMAYFILGIPVETYEDELNTIALAKKIRATYAQFSILSPYYGTKVYDDAIKKGWYAEVDAHNPMDKDLKRPVILSDNWDEEKLKRILKTAHREFYLRPAYMARLVLSIRSVHQAVGYTKEFLNVISWMQR